MKKFSLVILIALIVSSATNVFAQEPVSKEDVLKEFIHFFLKKMDIPLENCTHNAEEVFTDEKNVLHIIWRCGEPMAIKAEFECADNVYVNMHYQKRISSLNAMRVMMFMRVLLVDKGVQKIEIDPYFVRAEESEYTEFIASLIENSEKVAENDVGLSYSKDGQDFSVWEGAFFVDDNFTPLLGVNMWVGYEKVLVSPYGFATINGNTVSLKIAEKLF